MTSLRGFKLPILLAIFSALLSIGMVSPRPAAAQLFGAGCACVANDLSCTCIDQKLEQRLKQVILGQGAISAPTGPAEQLKYFKDATNSPETLGGYSSLTGYFENVWWPRYIKLNKIIGQEDGNKAAMDMANLSRQNAAGDMIGYQNTVNSANWENMKGFLGAEEVLCPWGSMSQSGTLLHFLAQQERVTNQQMNALKRGGSPNAPGPLASNGPTELAAKSVAESNQNGTCDPDGNAKQNKWCTNGKPNGQPPAGYHVLAETVLGQTAFVDDPKQPNNVTYADMFIARLFPNYFSPIRPDFLGPKLSERAAEVIHQQEAYAAALNVFQHPFEEMKSENLPRDGISAGPYIRKLLEKSGLPDEIANLVLGGDGKLSQAGADYAMYKVYMGGLETMKSSLTWNEENVTRFQTVATMAQISLLYDIRQELKENNAIVGALGSMMSRDLYNTVQAQTSAIAAQ